MSFQARDHWDLFAIILCSLVTGALVTFEVGGFLRFWFVAITIAIGPGYGAVASLFPRPVAENHPALAARPAPHAGLSWVDRVLYSVASSFGISMVVVYVASVLIGKVEFIPLAMTMLTGSISLAVVGMFRRARLLPQERAAFTKGVLPLGRLSGSQLRIPTVLIVILVAAALGTWSLAAKAFHEAPPTIEFYVADSSGGRFTHIDAVDVGQNQSLRLVTINRANLESTVRLDVSWGNVNGTKHPLLESIDLRLQPGQNISTPVSYVVPVDAAFVEFRLLDKAGNLPALVLTIRHGD